MAPASVVFPDQLFLFQTPDENDEQRFHCIYKNVSNFIFKVETQITLFAESKIGVGGADLKSSIFWDINTT
jgi:hypothetical protein